MSQQYGPPQQPPAQGGWGPGPMGPPQFRPAKSSRTQWIVMGGAVMAVLLIAVGVVLLVTGGGDDKQVPPVAGDSVTPDPIGTLYTPPTPTKPEITKGRYDTGVEVGGGVWFTPAKGWQPGTDKTMSGKYYLLPDPGRRGFIDGYYWVRQTQMYDSAKSFAEHLVDIESNALQDVRISKGNPVKCANPVLKACYWLSYSANAKSTTGRIIPFRGFVSAYQDGSGTITASDAGLEVSVYNRRVTELVYMNRTLEKSF